MKLSKHGGGAGDMPVKRALGIVPAIEKGDDAMTFGSNFRPGGAVREIRDAARAYGEYRRTVRQLGMLSDRDLSDLGLRRSDIRAVARDGSFWG